MRLGGLHWSWRVSGEAENTFASQKKDRKRCMREEKQMVVRMRYRIEMPS
jgi:hypothetical protein